MPTIAEAFVLAWQHHNAGALDQAQHLYQQIVQADPRHADAHHLLGVVAYQQGRHEAAIESIRRALTLVPGAAAFHTNIGLAQQALGQMQEALASFKAAVRLDLGDANAHNVLGNALRIQGQLGDAVIHCQHALRIQPDFVDAHCNLGNALFLQGRLDDALACYNQALRRQPDHVMTLTNMGYALKSQGRFDEALACTEQALRAQPDLALAHWNRALLWLLLGDFERGWAEYEWRWTYNPAARRHFAEPLWDGSPLPGKTILLYADQGFGDTFQFIRYVPLVKQRVGSIVVECPPPLVPILTNVPGIDQVKAQGSALPAFDVQMPLLSLPLVFRTSASTIPSAVPYLSADQELEKNWRNELDALQGFKVGIAWQGQPLNPIDSQRSIPLACFGALANVEGIRLISLQKGQGSDQLAALAGTFPVLDLGERLDEAHGPFMDSAAIIKNLDLVVSCDSAVLHLAGALGANVWAALPFVPDWRWQLNRADSPWYPMMRLFRQKRIGDWEGVFAEIVEAVRHLV